MLFLLTGEVQTGKTRWLTGLVDLLGKSGVTCEGVVAPGVWREHPEPDGAARYEKLGIDDNAIDAVNRHLQGLAAVDKPGPRLLVVNELGALELTRDGGLTAAVDLMEQGPSPARPHALAVVRVALVDLADKRFSGTWGGSARIVPGDEGRDLVLGAFERA